MVILGEVGLLIDSLVTKCTESHLCVYKIHNVKLIVDSAITWCQLVKIILFVNLDFD